MANERISKIMSWYAGENAGVLSNLYRMLNTGTLAGTGKMVILPVDQGFEHGPARSFAPNPQGYDPDYHYQLALDSGCNAYAAPLGALQASAAKFHGQIPLILKLNNSDSLSKMEPISAVTGSVQDALELGCSAIGYTIYPGSGERNHMLEELRELISEARSVGMPTIVWAYPRGSGVSKDGELALDVVAYGAMIAAQMGAHIIKVKPPKANIEGAEAKKVFEKYKIPTETLADRVRHVVQSAFNGKRIVIFSGGETKGTDELLADIKQIAAGGACGSIMGRNSFQRPHDEAVKLLHDVMAAFKNA